MTQKSVTIKAAWIGGIFLISATIISGLFGLFDKKSNNNSSIKSIINTNDSSNTDITINNNDVQGDFVERDKINNKIESKDLNRIDAPNALIVTQNQSGGENTVNINQITSQNYQRISNELNDLLNKNFDLLKTKYFNNPKIIIEIESGNSYRDKIARDLESFLAPRDLGIYPRGNTYIGRFPDYPVSLFSSSSNLNFTIDFLNSIKPYIESTFFIDTSFTSNEYVKIYFNGTPSFKNNGMVKIE